MKILLTENEVLELASKHLDLIQPNPDRLHEIAERLECVFDEDTGMFEDVEQRSLMYL